mmetsp:Transcript_94938/g.186270  ORF Transcript_94938/g.186270 Transcript_94938/m.186270 type:complete len:300 (+) Transcript_94938:65-964(+)
MHRAHGALWCAGVAATRGEARCRHGRSDLAACRSPFPRPKGATAFTLKAAMGRLVGGHLLILVNHTGVVHAPADAVPDRAGSLCVQREPPEPMVRAEDLLHVPSPPDVELALGIFLALQVLDRCVIIGHEVDMKLDEVCQGAQEEQREAEGDGQGDGRDDVPSAVERAGILDELRAAAPELREREDDNDEEAGVDVGEQLDEEFPVVETDAVVDPRTMVIHVQDAAVTNAAMVGAVRLPHVAHLAVAPPFGFITHIEAPIRRHDAGIHHHALIEGKEEVAEEDMVHEEEQRHVEAPKLR